MDKTMQDNMMSGEMRVYEYDLQGGSPCIFLPGLPRHNTSVSFRQPTQAPLIATPQDHGYLRVDKQRGTAIGAKKSNPQQSC